MQLSKQEVEPQIDYQIRVVLYQVVADIKNSQEAKVFLNDILTESELIALAKRLAIGLQLAEGKSYDAIRRQLKVSSATIASIQEKLAHEGGFRLALKKIEAEMWATKLATRILNFLGVKTTETFTSSK